MSAVTLWPFFLAQPNPSNLIYLLVLGVGLIIL